MAPAAESPILRNDISPEETPPPESGSASPRKSEKLEPVPEPYLNRRASRVHKSMMPPSRTKSSFTDWMKHACGCGRVYASLEGITSSVFGSTKKCPCAGPFKP